MPKTLHPKDVVKNENKPLQALFFTLHENREKGTQQASKTQSVRAEGDTALGSQGETRGFAKSQENHKEFGTPTRLFSNSTDGIGDCGLITRQVASCQTDRLLGLNVVAEERYGVGSDGKVIGISIQAEGSNIVSNRGVLQVDCRDPRIQKGLSDLQVVDFITGETDRHAGNIFINPATGKVTGIDNDLSFPEKRVGGNALAKMVGMPKVIHEDTKKKLLATDPEALRATLSTAPPKKNGPKPLSKAAIDGAVNRLIELQTELKKENSAIKVVKTFDDATYKSALDDANTAYLQQQRSSMLSKEQFQPMRMDEFAKMSQKDLAKLPSSAITSLDEAAKTSYLATVEMELAKNRMLTGNLKLPEYNTPIPLERNSRVSYEKTLADGYARMSKGEQKAFDKDFAKLNKMEEQLDSKKEHLKHPGVTDRLKAVVMGTIPVLHEKEQHAKALEKDIENLKESLKQQAELALAPTKNLVIPNVDVAPPRKELEKTQRDHVHTVLEDLTGNPGARRTKRQPQLELDSREHHSVAQDTGLSASQGQTNAPGKRIKVSLD